MAGISIAGQLTRPSGIAEVRSMIGFI